MSLIAAAGIGLGAGTVAGNFIFNYSKNEYIQKINELERFIARLKEHMEKLKELRGQVFEFWEDEDARNTCRVLDDTILEVETETMNAERLCTNYRTTVDSMSGAQGVLGQSIQDALAALTGLDL